MGASVESDDRKRIVHPHEVLMHESARNKGRKFALVGDNYQLSPAMYKLCQDCDVLVHEATLVGGESGEPAIERGHSSPESAGQVALDVNADAS
jgi:ribonuclease BN (tRNA processing enzyme)